MERMAWKAAIGRSAIVAGHFLAGNNGEVGVGSHRGKKDRDEEEDEDEDD